MGLNRLLGDLAELRYSDDQERDEGGRWTDEGGGSSSTAAAEPSGATATGFVPGQWTHLTTIAELANRLASRDPRVVAFGNPAYEKAIAEQIRNFYAYQPPLSVRVNGPVTIIEHLSESDWPADHDATVIGGDRTDAVGMDRLAGQIETLIQAFPPAGNGDVVVQIGRPGASAYACMRAQEPTDGVAIYLLGATPNDLKIVEPFGSGYQFTQQNSRATQSRELTMAHEWGHGTDRSRYDPSYAGRVEAAYEANRYGDGMSQYGKTASVEAFAESFSDWATSNGETRNPVTIDYATRFGWSK